MKSLVNPLNSIATALNRIASALESRSIIQPKQIEKKPFVPQKTTTSATANVYYSYSSSYITQQEKEAIDRIYKAVTDKGINSKHHDKMMDKLQNSWPVLHAAITALVVAKLEADKKKYNENAYDKIWKHKNDAF